MKGKWLSMDTDKSWLKFIKSGSPADYLEYVNSTKENEISGRNANTVHNRGTCNKGNQCGGE